MKKVVPPKNCFAKKDCNALKKKIPSPFYLRWWFWLIALIILFAMPFCIDRLFLIGQVRTTPNTTYHASDILGYLASVFTLLATAILGIMATTQARQANKMAKIMSQIEQAKMLSMVSLLKIEVHERPANVSVSGNSNFKDLLPVDMVNATSSVARTFHIDFTVKNHSNFPIVQLDIEPRQRDNDIVERKLSALGFVAKREIPVYIPEGTEQSFRLILPSSDCIKNYIMGKKLPLIVYFTNIVDMTTETTLRITIENVQSDNVKFKHTFRVSKVIDVFD